MVPGWLKPYRDMGGRGVLLPCTAPLFDAKGAFMGVAGVEMTLEYVRRALMSMPDMDGIEHTYLLDGSGTIVVDASGALAGAALASPRLYPREDVVASVLKKRSGYVSYRDHDRAKVLAYYRLGSIGWYFLAEADASTVKKPAGDAR